MFGSSVREPGGTRPIAIRCWRCAVRSIMAPSSRCLRGINTRKQMRKNHLKLPMGTVLGGLRRMQPTSAEARKAIDNCWIYLNGHRGRTDYGRLRRSGYPLGSGGMESANKFICHVRLKRSGAWWYEANSNQMLALRCAKYNG